MTWTRQDWPIAANMLSFSGNLPDGRTPHDADPAQWFDTFLTIAGAGFDRAEIADYWVRPGDLGAARLADLADAASQAGVALPAIAVSRRSILDPTVGADNLAYSHRTLDAAAELGVEVVCFGLHRPLTSAQRDQLWFWLADGVADDPADWDVAVAGFRELGQHAADLGLTVSLEMYEDTFLGTADSALRLLDEIGLDNVGLNPDTGNFLRLHRDIEPWRETLARTLPHANYWHLKNYYRDEEPAEKRYATSPAPLELGAIDYRWAIGEALRVGFDGMFVCEHYGGDSLTVGARNREYIRGILPSGEPRPVYRPRADDLVAANPRRTA